MVKLLARMYNRGQNSL